MPVAAVVLLLLVASAGGLGAQRQLSLEVTPVHGTLGFGIRSSPSVVRGAEIGFGFPQFDRTLTPGDEDLDDFLHLGVFQRMTVATRAVVDVRLQVGLAELHGCSGCLPGLLTALSFGGFAGWERVKFGARLTGGIIVESSELRSTVFNLRPFAVLLTW